MNEPTKITAKHVIERLKEVCDKSKHILIPNYHYGDFDNGFFECDLFELNKTGYFIEYEVKFSIADYRKDFEKADTNRNYERILNKHDSIKNGKRSNRFYFVIPAELIDKIELPKYAGLITFVERDGGYIQLSFRKIAPLLHRNKFTDFQTIAHSLYNRIKYRNQNTSV